MKRLLLHGPLRALVRQARLLLRARPRLRARLRAIPGFLPLLGFLLSHRGLRAEGAYARWAAQTDHLDPQTRAAMQDRLATLASRPKIAVVMPAYETPAPLLRAAINSVQRQIWPDWELCITDDASPSDVVSQVLAEFASDPRIRFVRRTHNGHISAATNTALGLVTADWVALMDHDDLLPEHALCSVGLHILAHPDAEVIFTDEDKVDDAGRRTGVYHKPGFDPDLLLGQNMVSHLGVYRRTLIERVGGLREGFEGSQDYDLALRASREVEPARIHHIPSVLYHWRQAAGGAPSFSEAALDRCVGAARRAIAEHLSAQGVEGAEVGPAPGLAAMNRVRWPLPSPLPQITLLLERGADPGPLPGWPGLEQMRSLGDRAAEAHGAMGEVLVFLGAECRPVEPEWLRELVSQALRPTVGVAGGPVFGPDRRIVDAGWVLGGPSLAQPAYAELDEDEAGHGGALRVVRRVSALGGGGFALRRKVLMEVGGFHPGLSDHWQLIELCARIRALGLAILCCPVAAVRALRVPLHKGVVSSGEQLLVRHAHHMTEEFHFSARVDPATGLPRLLPERPNPLALAEWPHASSAPSEPERFPATSRSS